MDNTPPTTLDDLAELEERIAHDGEVNITNVEGLGLIAMAREAVEMRDKLEQATKTVSDIFGVLHSPFISDDDRMRLGARVRAL